MRTRLSFAEQVNPANGAAVVYCTAPHRHLPVIILLPLFQASDVTRGACTSKFSYNTAQKTMNIARTSLINLHTVLPADHEGSPTSLIHADLSGKAILVANHTHRGLLRMGLLLPLPNTVPRRSRHQVLYLRDFVVRAILRLLIFLLLPLRTAGLQTASVKTEFRHATFCSGAVLGFHITCRLQSWPRPTL